MWQPGTYPSSSMSGFSSNQQQNIHQMGYRWATIAQMWKNSVETPSMSLQQIPGHHVTAASGNQNMLIGGRHWGHSLLSLPNHHWNNNNTNGHSNPQNKMLPLQALPSINFIPPTSLSHDERNVFLPPFQKDVEFDQSVDASSEEDSDLQSDGDTHEESSEDSTSLPGSEPPSKKVKTRNEVDDSSPQTITTEPSQSHTSGLKQKDEVGSDCSSPLDLFALKETELSGEKKSSSNSKALDYFLRNFASLEAKSPPLPDVSLSLLNWMKDRKLIHSDLICDGCNKSMNWIRHCRSIDKYTWKCQTKHCCKYKSRKSARTDSFFFRSRLPLGKWVCSMCLWTCRAGVKVACRQINVSEKTIVDCYSFFREVCCKYFENNSITLGGPGKVLQIGEICFSHIKPLQKASPTPRWIFCIVDVSQSPVIGYMEIINARDTQILLPIIERIAKPGSIVEAADWSAYNKLNEGKKDAAKNLLQFVAADNAFHNLKAETYLNQHKNYIKRMRGIRKAFLSNYLNEFMWFDRFPQNSFGYFCRHIATQFPL